MHQHTTLHKTNTKTAYCEQILMSQPTAYRALPGPEMAPKRPTAETQRHKQSLAPASPWRTTQETHGLPVTPVSLARTITTHSRGPSKYSNILVHRSIHAVCQSEAFWATEIADSPTTKAQKTSASHSQIDIPIVVDTASVACSHQSGGNAKNVKPSTSFFLHVLLDVYLFLPYSAPSPPRDKPPPGRETK